MVESQLPSETHYNFGLRTLTRIVDLASKNFSSLKETNEEKIIYLSILEILTKALNEEDFNEMKGVLSKFYKNVEVEEEDLTIDIPSENIIITPKIKKKVVEVKNALDNNTGIILYGKIIFDFCSICEKVLLFFSQKDPNSFFPVLTCLNSRSRLSLTSFC